MSIRVQFLIGFLVAVVFLNIVSAIGDGLSPIASTYLTTALSSSETTAAYVDNVTDFPSSGDLWIDEEYIHYDSLSGEIAFATLERGNSYGKQGTNAAFHSAGTPVYDDQTSFWESLLGFDIQSTTQSWGAASIIVIPVKFFWKTLPHMLAFSYSWLEGGMMVLRMFFLCFSGGFVVCLGLMVWGSLRG